jgi:hypothetical protein
MEGAPPSAAAPGADTSPKSAVKRNVGRIFAALRLFLLRSQLVKTARNQPESPPHDQPPVKIHSPQEKFIQELFRLVV